MKKFKKIISAILSIMFLIISLPTYVNANADPKLEIRLDNFMDSTNLENFKISSLTFNNINGITYNLDMDMQTYKLKYSNLIIYRHFNGNQKITDYTNTYITKNYSYMINFNFNYADVKKGEQTIDKSFFDLINDNIIVKGTGTELWDKSFLIDPHDTYATIQITLLSRTSLNLKLNNFIEGNKFEDVSFTLEYTDWDQKYISNKNYTFDDFKVILNTEEISAYNDIIGKAGTEEININPNSPNKYKIAFNINKSDFTPQMSQDTFDDLFKDTLTVYTNDYILNENFDSYYHTSGNNEGRVGIIYRPNNLILEVNDNIHQEEIIIDDDETIWEYNKFTYKTSIPFETTLVKSKDGKVLTKYKDSLENYYEGDSYTFKYKSCSINPVFEDLKVLQYPSANNNYTIKDNASKFAGEYVNNNITFAEVTPDNTVYENSYPILVTYYSDSEGDIIKSIENAGVQKFSMQIGSYASSIRVFEDGIYNLKQGDKLEFNFNIANNGTVTNFTVKEGNESPNTITGYSDLSQFTYTYEITKDFSLSDVLYVELESAEEITCKVKLIRKDGTTNYRNVGDVFNPYYIPNNKDINTYQVPGMTQGKYYYMQIQNNYYTNKYPEKDTELLINSTKYLYTNVFYTGSVSTSHTKKYNSKEVNQTIAIDVSTGEKKEEAVIKGSGKKGSTMTISLPENRRVLEVLVTDKKGNNIELNKEDDKTYSFVQPASNVNVDIKYINKEITLNLNNTEADIDGEKKVIDVMPQIKNDRTMVPLRFIMETLGLNVEWLPEDPDIVRYKNADGTTTIINLATGQAFLEGKEVELDAKPYVEKDRTMVPVRFISESAGCEVRWDEKNPNEVKIYEVE